MFLCSGVAVYAAAGAIALLQEVCVLTAHLHRQLN